MIINEETYPIIHNIRYSSLQELILFSQDNTCSCELELHNKVINEFELYQRYYSDNIDILTDRIFDAVGTVLTDFNGELTKEGYQEMKLIESSHKWGAMVMGGYMFFYLVHDFDYRYYMIINNQGILLMSAFIEKGMEKMSMTSTEYAELRGQEFSVSGWDYASAIYQGFMMSHLFMQNYGHDKVIIPRYSKIQYDGKTFDNQTFAYLTLHDCH